MNELGQLRPSQLIYTFGVGADGPSQHVRADTRPRRLGHTLLHGNRRRAPAQPVLFNEDDHYDFEKPFGSGSGLTNIPSNALPIVGAPYVLKSGDTMTGLLTLSGDPTVNLQAATKQYVDAERTRAQGAETVLTTNLNGEVSRATTAEGTKVAKAGDTMTGSLTLSGDPSANLHAATKQYVDATASASASRRLPIA